MSINIMDVSDRNRTTLHMHLHMYQPALTHLFIQVNGSRDHLHHLADPQTAVVFSLFPKSWIRPRLEYTWEFLTPASRLPHPRRQIVPHAPPFCTSTRPWA